MRPVTLTIDFAAAGVILGSLAGALPPLAALAAILWYVVQIYESKTVQRWRRLKRRAAFRRGLLIGLDAETRKRLRDDK